MRVAHCLAIFAAISVEAHGSVENTSLVTTRLVAQGGPAPKQVTLSAVSIDSYFRPISRRGTYLDPPRLEVRKGVWTISALADGYWSLPRTVDASGGDVTVEIKVWPAGVLRGTLTGSTSKRRPPNEVSVSFQFAGLPKVGYLATEGCRTSGSVWQCSLPVGTLNVRIKPDGYVPRYFFNVGISPAVDTTVGLLTLERGVSIVGNLLEDSGAAALGARVELRSANGEPLIGSAPATTRSRGFFQLVAQSSGTFSVYGEVEGRSAHSALFTPTEGADELQLASPLYLKPAAALVVEVSPALDPEGNRWRLQLVRIDGRKARLLGSGGRADDGGRWKQPVVAPGQYWVGLATARGIKWRAVLFDAAPGVTTVNIEAQPCPLAGSLLIGKRPLKARLLFGGNNGATSIPAESDESGEFTTAVPCTEDLFAREWTVLVRWDDSSRTVTNVRLEGTPDGGARTKIVITDSRLTVRVVDERGVALSNPVLSILDKRGRTVEQALWSEEPTSERGRIVVPGLEYGSYVAIARTGPAAHAQEVAQTADPVAFDVSEASPERDLTITVKKNITVAGVVVDQDGVPLSGVDVRLLPSHAALMPMGVETTDPAGRFQVQLPSTTREVALAAWRYGFAYKIARVDLPLTEGIVIRMTRQGGTLILNHDRPVWEEPVAYVFRGGSFAAAAVLRNWATLHAELSAESGNRIVIPSMEPGTYSACRIDTIQLANVVATGVPPAIHCKSGQLVAGSELTLDTP